MGENINNTKSKNSKTGIWITLAIVLTIIIGLCISVMINNITKKQKDDRENKEAAQKAYDFLNEKYEDDFEFVSTIVGYKSNVTQIDATYAECGHDENIRQYIFYVDWDIYPLMSCVTVWKNIEEGTFSVHEGSGNVFPDSKNVTYEEIKDKYFEYLNMKQDLDNILKESYNIYLIDYKENECVVKIHEYMLNNTDKAITALKRIKDLIDDTRVEVRVIYYDYNDIIDWNKDNEDIEEDISAMIEVSECLKKYGVDNQITKNGDSVTVKIPVNIKRIYKTREYKKYDAIYEELKKIKKQYYIYIYIKFNDLEAQVETYNEKINLRYYIESED